MQRVRVVGPNHREERVYDMTLIQRLGGRYDGFWFVDSLVGDDSTFEGMKGP